MAVGNEDEQQQGIWSVFDASAIAISTIEQKGLASDQQVALTVGDALQITEVAQKKGWYRGINLATQQTGIFPINYVLVRKGDDNIDSVSSELVTVIREWGGLLKNYFKERRMQEYKIMKERLALLMEWHSKIFSPKVAPDAKDSLKAKVIDKIQEGRLLMGLDMVVRTANNDLADESNTGIIPLYRMHQELANQTDTKNASLPASAPRAGRRVEEQATTFHLFMEFKIFMCAVGEQTEIYFSLYNRPENRFVSDEYQIVLTNLGMPTDLDKMDKLKTIFTELTKKDVTGLYLVCRLVRRGKMLVGDTKKEKAGVQPNRRPFGCSVLELDRKVGMHVPGTPVKLNEHTVPIYSPNQESSFPILHELIIKGASNMYAEPPRSMGVCMGLIYFTGDYKQLIKSDSALAAVWPTQKLGMPEMILPGFHRNDLFIQLEGGEFSQERKTAQKNVEVLMMVILENGEIVKDAIYTGSDKPKPEWRSVVYYHSNQPHWNETVRVVLPTAKLQQAYLVLYSRHVSTDAGKKTTPNAVSYLKLTNPDGTIIPDKVHNIPAYKPGKTLDEPVPNMKDPAMAKLLRKGEVLRVRTYLCSTVCTQNISLLSLLKWDTYSGDLADLMNRYTFVDQGEIIKFAHQIFDAMFAILESNRIENKEPVYNAIVFTISLLVDEKSSHTNYRPVLDVYIDNYLRSVKAHVYLINCLKNIFAKVSNQQAPLKAVMPTLKSLEYIIKFIVVSWLNYLKTNPAGQQEQHTNFKKDLISVLGHINGLMMKTEREFIGAQTVALKNFMSIFTDLERIFDISERSQIAIEFIDSVRYDEGRKLLNNEKLQVIQSLLESELFLRDDVRGIMLPTLARNLKHHLSGAATDDVLKIGKILQVIIESLQIRIKDATSPALSAQVAELATILPEIMTCVRALGRSRARLDLVHVMFSIFFLMEPSHFDSFLKDGSGVPRKQYLLTTFDLMVNILSNSSAYPENWFALMLFEYAVIRKIILNMTPAVLSRAKMVSTSAPQKPRLSTSVSKINTSALELQNWSNTPIGQEYDIWISYLKLCIVFLKAKGLALESFSETKQKNITKSRNGDLRSDVIQALKTLWDALGPHQSHMLDDAVGPVLELIIINQPTIRSTGLSLYTSLLRSEYANSGLLERMEKGTINTLDRMLSDTSAENVITEYRTAFTVSLPAQFVGDDALCVRAQKFLKDTSTFMELLYALRTLPNTIEYEDDRTIASMKLMAYLKQSDRLETYVKYVHKLSSQHLSSSNFIEAGLTILLHADLLNWTDEVVDELPEVGYPSEFQRDRKERLYKLAVDYLDKGKAWEKAIQLLEQLRKLYEFTLYDYPKLADVLQMESTFYRKIVGVERFFAEYFRVGYYGKGFDPSLHGKEFIYRGFELERMADFAQRIQTKFPNAKLLTYTEMPPPEITNGSGQHLQIFMVKPFSEEINEVTSKSSVPVPPAIVKYRQCNDVRTFMYSKPFRKIKAKSDNEFKDLWMMDVHYVTEDTFPTTHRRSEVVKKTVIELPPIDNAYNAIKSKNNELVEMTQKYEKNTESNTNPFTMVLKGVIDAAVNGGVMRYQEAFFAPEYAANNPEHSEKIGKLRQSLSDQVGILEKGLAVHAKICTQEMLSLHEKLEEQMVDLKTKIGRDSQSAPNGAPSTPVAQRFAPGPVEIEAK